MSVPIDRYWNYGLSFRLKRGDPHVVVKKGYVIEGKSVTHWPKGIIPGITIKDQPDVDINNDKHTWLTTIPFPSGMRDQPWALEKVADKWAKENHGIADLKKFIPYKGLHT